MDDSDTPLTVRRSLSPSRAGDFQNCPLLYRFRTIDRLPEPADPIAVRGTLVHAVLEDLFGEAAPGRTLERAVELLPGEWEKLRAEESRLAELFTAEQAADETAWLASCVDLLETYFGMEDPRYLEPASREDRVSYELESGVTFAGIVDRIDIAPDGRIRVVDYKGLAVDTPLPTPDGWTTMGEVQVGDQLFGSDGRPVRVTKKSGVHHRPCYRVTFRDGSEVVCDNVHLWTVVRSHRQVRSTMTVDTDRLAEIMREVSAAGTPRSVWVETAAALETDETELVVDPWLLGAWLGDGSTRSGRISVGKRDLSDMSTLIKEHWSGEVRCVEESTAYSVTPVKLSDRCTFGHNTFRPATPGHETRRCAHEQDHRGMDAWNLSLSTLLGQIGVRGNKHIPPIYLRAGVEQRRELLRGLMDTDGWWSLARRRAGFTTTNDRLAADVVELLRSLGINPQHFTKDYENAIRADRTWHIIEFTPGDFNPFSLARKAILAEVQVTPLQRELTRRRVIASVEPVESVPTQCVAVDAADSLYLCGRGFVPTHNTGKAPNPRFEDRAMFQMRFYALVIWRTRGVLPTLLQLMYLGDGSFLTYEPDEQELLATERKLLALWAAIERAIELRDFPPRKSGLCGWCAHKALCPEFGGTPPEMPFFEVVNVTTPAPA
ncbi:PD-(D/E)XK nuclease family protein [Aeromicrobium sp.]|uniref:PD-(D/E)XK nuclease family protein n=1 Tax=Aeromicrobium sp. TaxID=1871063 RepID=UPI002FCA134F